MKAPVNEVLAGFRRSYLEPRNFLEPRPIYETRVEMPPPSRNYPWLNVMDTAPFTQPWSTSLNSNPYWFDQLLPVDPRNTPLPGQVVYRDALGDIFRH